MQRYYATDGKNIIWFFDKAFRDKHIKNVPGWRMINKNERTAFHKRERQPNQKEEYKI